MVVMHNERLHAAQALRDGVSVCKIDEAASRLNWYYETEVSLAPQKYVQYQATALLLGSTNEACADCR